MAAINMREQLIKIMTKNRLSAEHVKTCIGECEKIYFDALIEANALENVDSKKRCEFFETAKKDAQALRRTTAQLKNRLRQAVTASQNIDRDSQIDEDQTDTITSTTENFDQYFFKRPDKLLSQRDIDYLDNLIECIIHWNIYSSVRTDDDTMWITRQPHEKGAKGKPNDDWWVRHEKYFDDIFVSIGISERQSSYLIYDILALTGYPHTHQQDTIYRRLLKYRSK